jgi:Flp pilus assembly CpaF family ATPase
VNIQTSRLDATGPIGPQERRLIDELTNRVGDLLADWANDQSRQGREVDVNDRRQYARVLIKKELEQRNAQLLSTGAPVMDESRKTRLATEVVARLTGAGALQTLMDRTDWSDIHVIGTEVFIDHLDGSQSEFGHIASSTKDVAELIRKLAATAGQTSRQFNATNPILSMSLATGERLTALGEIVDSGVTCTIRRNATPKMTFDDMVKKGNLPALAASFMKSAVRCRLNWVVTGGTGTGKTTFLRAAGQEFGASERIVTIEDAFELRLRDDRLRNVVALETRVANVEGVGAITMVELAKAALRLTPTRVILGEVRGAECESFIDACTQGQSGSCCSVHADSSDLAPYRLRWLLAKAMPAMSQGSLTDAVAQAVELVVHIEMVDMGVDSRGDDLGALRRVTSIREITGSEGEVFKSNEVFTFTNGVLEPTGALSEKLRRKLAKVGFDASTLGSSTLGLRR